MGFEEAFQAADLAVRAIREEGLRDIERVVLEGSWNRLTYQKIASQAGYTEGYLSRDVGPALWTLLSEALAMPVKKTNFRTAIERWSRQHPIPVALDTVAPTEGAEPVAATRPAIAATSAIANQPPPIDVTDFRGREAEIADLQAWILRDRGRLLCVSGCPGVGKTWLAVKLSQGVQSQIPQVIYRALDDRPDPVEVLSDLLSRLGVTPPSPATVPACLDRLLAVLAQTQVLIILDSAEAVYQPNAFAGVYAAAFEGYGLMLETLTTRDHQSCLIWVGRERPRSAAQVSGSSCRFHTVTGLSQKDLATLAVWPETLAAAEADWQQLRDRYGGLPALMQGIASRLSPFGNRLGTCLAALEQDNRFVHDYIATWLAPLSETEWAIVIWLTLSQRSLSLADLATALEQAPPFAAIDSLCDRGLCRSRMSAEPRWELALPELLTPFVCDRIIQSFRTVDERGQVHLLHQYPLVQTDAPETVRQWQQQTLLAAIAAVLAESLPDLADKQRFLKQALPQSRDLSAQQATGYSAGNLINLATYWQISLATVDCHGLMLRGADLQSDDFQGVIFTAADFSETLLAKPLGQAPIIAVSPDQRQVAVGDQDGRLLLWTLYDGRLQRAMLTVSEAISVITFSPDGATLAEGRQDGSVRLWDLQSEYGPELFAAASQVAMVALAFSPDRQLLAGGDAEGTLYIWRLASGQAMHDIAAHSGTITAIAWSPCSRRITTCGQDCTAIEWEVSTGDPRHRFQGRLTNWLGTVAYLSHPAEPELQAAVVGRDEGQLVIWDIQSARPLRVMTDPCDLVMAVALSPNGRYLAASEVSNTLSVWDVDARSRLYALPDSQAPVEALVFSPDSTELMTGCDYTVQRWQVQSGNCLRSWRSDRHPAVRLALAPAPLRLISSHDDGTLRCWQRPITGDRWLPQGRYAVPDDAPVSAIDASPLGGYWGVGTESGTVHLWRVEEQRWVSLAVRLPGRITALAFSPTEAQVVVGDATGTVALWHLPECTFGWQQSCHRDQVMAIAFAPDGQSGFTGSRDRGVQGWDLQGNAVCTLTEHRRRVHTLCVAGDGQTLYSGSYDGTIRCWELMTYTCIRVWQHSDRLIHAVTRDAQHHVLAIISDTQTLEIWDVDTDTHRASLPAHDETVWHVGASPAGQALVSADQDGRICIWSAASGQLQGQLRVDRPYEGMQIGGCKGLTQSERQMLYSLGAIDY